MTAKKTSRFLVVVVPGKQSPVGNAMTTGATYTLAAPNTVRASVEAESAAAAAEKVGVPAGATAYVAKLAHVAKFKRPEQAKLEAA